MSTASLEIVPKQLAVTSEQRALAKSTVAKGLTEPEFDLYLYNCDRQGVHPLDGLIVPLIRTSNQERKLTFVTTVDLLRSRAAESNEYAGSEDATFEYVEGTTYPQSATVSVWRLVQGQRCMFTATARWTEYYPDDKQGFMWRGKPHVMLGKCAEALALRKAFPKQLAGLYIPEEMDKPESAPSESAPEPVKKTAPKSAQAVPQSPPPAAVSTPTQPQSGELVVTEKQLKMLFALQKSAGMTDEVLKAHLAPKGITSRKDIPRSMFQDVIDFVDPEFKFHAPRQDNETW